MLSEERNFKGNYLDEQSVVFRNQETEICLENIFESRLLHVQYVSVFTWLLVGATHSIFIPTDKSGGSSRSNHHEGGRILKNSPPPKPKAISLERTEVFATVLFTEFLKELAAIAQEHSILSYIPMEE